MLFENHLVVGGNHAVYDGRTIDVEKQGEKTWLLVMN
jgi:hypothetical protein